MNVSAAQCRTASLISDSDSVGRLREAMGTRAGRFRGRAFAAA